MPAAEGAGGFVVEGAPCGGDAEAACQRQFRVVPRIGVEPVVGVGVGQDQLLDAGLFEDYRGGHRRMAVEAEDPEEPAVGTVVAGAENEVLGQGVFRAGLPEREVGERQKVLVERHRVVGVLVRGDRRDGEGRGVVAEREAVAQSRAAVARRVVVADLAGPDDGLSVADDLLAGIGVGIASLFEHRKGEGVVETQPLAVAPLRAPAAAAEPFPVAFAARREVLEKASGTGVVTRDGRAQPGCEFLVERSPETVAVAAAVFGREAHALPVERREGVDVDDAAHRVAAVEGRLGPAQNLDTLDFGQLRVEVVLVHHRHVVDVQPHDRLVDACAQSADVDRRSHARPVVGDMEVGHVLRQIPERDDAVAPDGAAADDRRGDGLRAQHHALLDGRDLHLVHDDHRVGRLRIGGRRRAFHGVRRGRKGREQQQYGQQPVTHDPQMGRSGVQSNGFILVAAILICEETAFSGGHMSSVGA